MKAKLYRIILPVKDIDKAENFYSRVFGAKGIRVSPGRHYFNLNGVILACYDPEADGDNLSEWNFHENQYIYIAVADLEKTRSIMKELDCYSLGEIETMPWGETLFYANDPFGNPICFVDEETVFKGNE
ncbi:VOC family protein [Aquimarina aggregata]|uniref:VOC family protein n=1 Tax=Aquimarina aggregata TaxID=1642818 RepID=UPI002491A9C9|nr:VOC family protein [Aquimarina aggregata]